MPSREIFWNIDYGNFLYFLLTPLAAILAYAVYQRYRLWRLGRPDNRLSNLRQSLWAFVRTGIVDGVIHRRFLREPYPGLMHFLIFWGAVVFLLAAATDFITHYFVGELEGRPYLGVSVTVDVLGVLALVGVGIAAFRRYIQRPSRLDNTPDKAVALSLIFVIILTGFIIEGLRLAALDPDWTVWSPGGWVLAQAFDGLARGTILDLHRALWWFHVALSLGAIVYVALNFSPLAHIVVDPFNVLFRSMRPKGALTSIELVETAESYGASRITDFTWKQLFDLDACTRCGRCQDVCPAYATGKALSPKKVIQELKRHWLAVGPSMLAQKATATNPGDDQVSMIGDVIREEEIWDCTTCRACQEACPVFIEHIDKIIDMRRHLVLETGTFSETLQDALVSLENRGHPWRGTALTRTDWFKELKVKMLSESDGETELLYWVGCTSALDERNTKVTIAVAKILQAAGVDFAILGEGESCCGDPARRAGEEYLFQTLCQKNIEVLQSHNVKKILTSCPHGFNTLKNEYPQFGGNFEVIHHSQFILDLIRQGRLKLGQLGGIAVAYHDSCYLGRYNDIYDEPREILKETKGITTVELRRRRERSFCCGAGGAHMWLEEAADQRVNVRRVEEVIEAKVDVVATACPYCLTMFEDALTTKGVEETIKVKDISELVVEAAGLK